MMCRHAVLSIPFLHSKNVSRPNFKVVSIADLLLISVLLTGTCSIFVWHHMRKPTNFLISASFVSLKQYRSTDNKYNLQNCSLLLSPMFLVPIALIQEGYAGFYDTD